MLFLVVHTYLLLVTIAWFSKLVQDPYEEEIARKKPWGCPQWTSPKRQWHANRID